MSSSTTFAVQLTSKDGDNITLDLDASAENLSVRDFRAILEEKDASCAEAKLIFKGKILKDDMLLKDIGMTEEGLKDGKGKVVFMRAKGKKPVVAGGVPTTDGDGDAVMGNVGGAASTSAASNAGTSVGTSGANAGPQDAPAAGGAPQNVPYQIDPEVVDNLLAITGFTKTREEVGLVGPSFHKDQGGCGAITGFTKTR